MNIGRIGSITNHGGVVNLGTIHGDVTASIQHALGPADEAATLKQALLELTDAIHANAERIAGADDALERVRKVAEESAAPKPDAVVIGRHIDLISKALATVPVLLDVVGRVRHALAGLFG